MTQFPFKHIIWDWNGTLLDDSWLSVEVINAVLAKRRMPTINHEQYISIFGFPVIDYYKRLGFDFIKESFEVIGTEFIDGYEARKFELALHKGALDVLKSLTEQGISHSILSAYKQNMLDELMTHMGVSRYFQKIIGLDNHYAKSKVDNGIQWMAELPYEQQEVLFVGDTAHDYEVAQAIGVECVLIPGGHQTKDQLVKTGAIILDDIREIMSLTAERESFLA